jgi:Ulp1 family protease
MDMSKKNKEQRNSTPAIKQEPVITGENAVSAPGVKKMVLTAEEIEQVKKDFAAQKEQELTAKAKVKELKEKAKELGISLIDKADRGPTTTTFIDAILKEDADALPNSIARRIIIEHPELNPFTVVAAIQKRFRKAKVVTDKDDAAPANA